MKVSYNWLQEYFEEKLPKAEELGELLTFHAYEIEEIEKVGDDSVIDIDVLPNRSGDSLSHIGVAREIATLLDKKLQKDSFDVELTSYDESKVCSVEVEDKNLCSRYSATIIKGVEIKKSPEWLTKSLETLGQKSINNVVDATNFVMLNLGQPLHAFDLNKLEGEIKKIGVRNAKKGEKITTLTGDEYELDESNLLITDANKHLPIGIAGVKGGILAEIDTNTKDIVIEAASFDRTSIRKTSQKLKLWTDASTRFQNNPSAILVGYAVKEVVNLITNIAGGIVEGGVDVDNSNKEEKKVSVTLPQINNLLGTSLNTKEAVDIFRRLQFDTDIRGEEFSVTPPFYRRDINIYEDLIEEIGRVYGYEHLEAKELPKINIKPEINKKFYYADKIRNILVKEGYSEILGYTFRKSGDYEAIISLASDKAHLRTNLSDGMLEYLDKNHKNAPLLGIDRVKIFEIGNVFPKKGEYTSLTIGISGKKTDKLLNETKELLEKELNTKISNNPKDGALEINFTKLIDGLERGGKYENFKQNLTQYKPFSLYPFMLRDIAVWVSSSVTDTDVGNIIKQNTGGLLVNSTKFDEFEKDGKKSYAYHLVFQSNERTLNDGEINNLMEDISTELNKNNGWEVR